MIRDAQKRRAEAGQQQHQNEQRGRVRNGLLRDPADESTLLQKVGLSEVPLLVREGVIQGGMIPKVECCVEAVRSGVERTHILDGRIPHSILIELLSDEGIGTMIL